MHPDVANKVMREMIEAKNRRSNTPFYTEVFDEAEDRWVSIATVSSYKTGETAWVIRAVQTGERLIDLIDYEEILAHLRLNDPGAEEYGTW